MTHEGLVALVCTSDRDWGADGQVRCALYRHGHFRRQPAYAGSYLAGRCFHLRAGSGGDPTAGELCA